MTQTDRTAAKHIGHRCASQWVAAGVDNNRDTNYVIEVYTLTLVVPDLV